MIKSAVIRSPLSLALRLHRESPRAILSIEAKLLGQVRKLGMTLAEANSNYMFNLFDGDEALAITPEYYSAGSWGEMALTMQHSYAAWWETEGVLDLLNDAHACAARNSETEIEDMMQSKVFESGFGSHRTPEELLADVSVNRIWGYLDYAVENASYLGP